MSAAKVKIGRYETGGDGSEESKKHRWEEKLPIICDCGFVMQYVV
jgi:hypothetical protein